jgi:hypothetical protein
MHMIDLSEELPCRENPRFISSFDPSDKLVLSSYLSSSYVYKLSAVITGIPGEYVDTYITTALIFSKKLFKNARRHFLAISTHDSGLRRSGRCISLIKSANRRHYGALRTEASRSAP